MGARVKQKSGNRLIDKEVFSPIRIRVELRNEVVFKIIYEQTKGLDTDFVDYHR